MSQLEFYKSFLFVIELLVAEGLFLFRFKRKSNFIWRLIAATILSFLFAILFPVVTTNAFYCSFMFLMIFAFTVLMTRLVFKINWQMSIFCCLAGYTTQHLSYEIYNLMLLATNVEISNGFYGQGDFTSIFPNLFVFSIYLIVYVFSYSLCYVFFGRKIETHESLKMEKKFIFVFSAFILLIDILLNAIVVYNPISDAKIYMYVISIYNILCCCVSLYLQFEFALRKKIENTFEFMQQMWAKTKKQYNLSKQSIEMINMKCHDFKHQIRSFGESSIVNTKTLQELEGYIKVYDSCTRTGNEAVDVIVTEKTLLCNKNKINLTCIIDESRLTFMSEEDVYALFGNILDNAIEAVINLEENKRVISLQVKMVNEMLVIQETNYFEGELKLKNGLPQTTKSNKDLHGLGTKSIRFIVEKYGGECVFSSEDNIFKLNIILFPNEFSE